MADQRELIAELIALLPMFMGTLLEESGGKIESGLNISERRTLLCVHRHEGVTMTGYSRRVGLARGSFTTVADSLEQKGLVSRVSGSDDRRKCLLVLTKEGKDVARDLDRQVKKEIAAGLNRLTEEELHHLNSALETIVATTKKLEDRRSV